MTFAGRQHCKNKQAQNGGGGAFCFKVYPMSTKHGPLKAGTYAIGNEHIWRQVFKCRGMDCISITLKINQHQILHSLCWNKPLWSTSAGKVMNSKGLKMAIYLGIFSDKMAMLCYMFSHWYVTFNIIIRKKNAAILWVLWNLCTYHLHPWPLGRDAKGQKVSGNFGNFPWKVSVILKRWEFSEILGIFNLDLFSTFYEIFCTKINRTELIPR